MICPSIGPLPLKLVHRIEQYGCSLTRWWRNPKVLHLQGPWVDVLVTSAGQLHDIDMRPPRDEQKAR